VAGTQKASAPSSNRKCSRLGCHGFQCSRDEAISISRVQFGGRLDLDNRSLVGAGRSRLDCRDRRGLRDVQRSCFIAQATARRHVEQRLVFVIRVRGDQLHEELELRRVRRRRLMDRRISLDDFPTTIERSVRFSRNFVAFFYWNVLTDSPAPLPVVSGSDQPPGGTILSFTSFGPHVPGS
jgi:hypothetical protein